MSGTKIIRSHEAGKCSIKRMIPLGAQVIDIISAQGARVIALNPSDEAEGLVGVRWLDNGHEDKIHRDRIL